MSIRGVKPKVAGLFYPIERAEARDGNAASTQAVHRLQLVAHTLGNMMRTDFR